MKSRVAWLQRAIDDAWEKRHEITPSCKSVSRPQLIDIFKRLPRTNCKKCGQPTCMAFAAQVMEGGRYVTQCPELTEQNKSKLSSYLSGFVFE